jgi:hypothetical protein
LKNFPVASLVLQPSGVQGDEVSSEKLSLQCDKNFPSSRARSWPKGRSGMWGERLYFALGPAVDKVRDGGKRVTRDWFDSIANSISKVVAKASSIFVVGLVSQGAWAIPSPLPDQLAAQLRIVGPGQKSPLVRSGVVTGGQAADEFTLISIRTEALASGGERWIFQYGDRFGKPFADPRMQPGFFHIGIDKSSRRIVMDLAQVHRTGFGAEALAKLAAESGLVGESDMVMDPHDRSTSVTLSLKVPSVMRVVQAESPKGRIVLEIAPARQNRIKR